VQRQGGLAGAFRPVNLDHAAARQAADAEADVEAEGAGRDHLGFDNLVGTELHDRALAESTLDLPQRRVQSLFLVHRVFLHQPQSALSHQLISLMS
jgi:hypothetical protein